VHTVCRINCGLGVSHVLTDRTKLYRLAASACLPPPK
jgi:hypothetical protein